MVAVTWTPLCSRTTKRGDKLLRPNGWPRCQTLRASAEADAICAYKSSLYPPLVMIAQSSKLGHAAQWKALDNPLKLARLVIGCGPGSGAKCPSADGRDAQF